MRKLLIILLFVLPLFSFAQNSNADTNYIFWTKERRLQESDFKIKVAHVSTSYSFAQYGFDYYVVGPFSLGLPKNYKKKIRNYFVKSASWLDTTYDVKSSIKYQQTLFDLAEVYIRKFRKSIYANRKNLAWGKVKIEELNSQALTDFSNRRVEYDTTTNFGTVSDKQKDWEALIEKELDDLQSFSAE